MTQTISVLVENRAGVLNRITGLFARRAFNIESLAVGITEDPNFSRVTIVVEGTDYTVEQVEKQLNKLIDVIKVRTIHPEELISRELVLIYAKNRSDMVHVGFSVGKKLGNSVVRNRVKRRLREAFRPNLPLLLPGFDLIVIARDAARDAPFSSLADSLRYLLRKAGLFQKPKRP